MARQLIVNLRQLATLGGSSSRPATYSPLDAPLATPIYHLLLILTLLYFTLIKSIQHSDSNNCCICLVMGKLCICKKSN